jgi:hypothetical protein
MAGRADGRKASVNSAMLAPRPDDVAPSISRFGGLAKMSGCRSRNNLRVSCFALLEIGANKDLPPHIPKQEPRLEPVEHESATRLANSYRAPVVDNLKATA